MTDINMFPERIHASINGSDSSVEYIRADLVPTWRDIGSAPKDGTEIDVWCASDVPGDNGGFRVADAWWCRVDKK
jgi:hypothetical protein